MNKKVLAKVTSFMMAICMMFGFASSLPVYAQESETVCDIKSETSAQSNRPILKTYDAGEIPWAQTCTRPAEGFVVHNYMDMYITASSKENTHRMVVRPYCRVYPDDPNQSDIKITITLSRNGVKDCEILRDTFSTLAFTGPQSNWFSVRPGERIMLRIDASTKNSWESTGNFRYADIFGFEMYCD